MATDLETKKKQLFKYAMKGKWEEVISLYGEDPRLHKAKITRSGSTALHVAVSEGNEDVVEQMVELAGSCQKHCKEALQTQNERKNTALHLAASMGNLRMCQLIAQIHPDLVTFRNVDGETPLFLAAFDGRKEAFLCLHHLSHPNNSPPNYDNCRRNGGDTILHCAITGDFYDLAFQIIYMYGDLVNYVNEDGLSPLHLLAAKPSDFQSGSSLGRYERIIYNCIFVEELEVAEYHHQPPSSEGRRHEKCCNLPDNYRTCWDIFGVVKASLTVVTTRFSVAHFLKNNFFPKGEPSNGEDPEVARNNNKIGSECKAHGNARRLYPENYEPCCKFFKFVYLAVALILGQGYSGLKIIRRKKEKHVWSLQIMNELLRRASLYEYEIDGSEPIDYASDTDQEKDERVASSSLDQESKITNPGNNNQQQDKGWKDSKEKRTETPILIAARNGVAEMVEKTIELYPVAIHDMNEEKKNVVLLAVEHRQLHVYQLLLQRNIPKESALRKVDHKGNNALHLAAKFGPYGPSLITDAALQIMQWEIKWFEFVKGSVPSHLFARCNYRNKTPSDIFIETHTPLVQSGGESLNKTSKSCSVVAALVAGVSFATSSTVPGGNDDKTGKPTLQGHPGFDIFAISALIALCFSVTALIIFLSILTSQKLSSDFFKKLPVKLFLALSSLFVSIFSMFISFCTAHSFVLEDRFKKAVLPLYAIICLPIYFTIMEFPLYMDLFKGIFMNVQSLYDQRRNYKVLPFKFIAEEEEGGKERKRRSYE